jgi:hypothetical protein
MVLPKAGTELMSQWTISYDGNSCQPTVLTENVKQDTPTVSLGLNEKRFSVEFKNRSDYMASRHGSLAEVTIISANRSKRFKELQ